MTDSAGAIGSRLARDRRRSLAWWSGGMAMLVFVSVAFYPSVKDQDTIDDLVKDLPEAMKSLFGFDEAISFSSPAGYLHGRLFALLALALLLVFAVGLAARITGGSEEDGTLELLLANPVTRRRVMLERLAALVALLVLLGVVLAAATLALSPLFGALDGIRFVHVLAACAGAVALALTHAMAAFTVGAATGRRAPAVAAATTLAVAGYLISGLAAVSDLVHSIRFLSPWHWYLGRNMLAHGLAPDAVLAPLAVTLVLGVAGIRAFERRDLRGQ